MISATGYVVSVLMYTQDIPDMLQTTLLTCRNVRSDVELAAVRPEYHAVNRTITFKLYDQLHNKYTKIEYKRQNRKRIYLH